MILKTSYVQKLVCMKWKTWWTHEQSEYRISIQTPARFTEEVLLIKFSIVCSYSREKKCEQDTSGFIDICPYRISKPAYAPGPSAPLAWNQFGGRQIHTRQTVSEAKYYTLIPLRQIWGSVRPRDEVMSTGVPRPPSHFFWRLKYLEGAGF